MSVKLNPSASVIQPRRAGNHPAVEPSLPAPAAPTDDYQTPAVAPVTLNPPSGITPEVLVESVELSKQGLERSSTALSVEQLTKIMPHLKPERASALLPHLNRAMQEAGITSPKRAAAFLAQLAHESGEFRYFEEIASGAAYEGRRDLGNTQPGDGRRFKGRGPIQLTGRSNYERAGKALGLDLVNNPELAARPDVGFRVAGWYWKQKGLNELADKGNFTEITRRINGGQNGAADRVAYLAKASAALGAGFSGGPMATGATPVPQLEASTPTLHTAGRDRIGQSYGFRVSDLLKAAFALAFSQLVDSVDPQSLAEDEEFKRFEASLGSKRKPGEPVSEALKAEFIAQQLARRVEAGVTPEAAAQELTARFPRVP